MKKLTKPKFINAGCWPVYIGYSNTEKSWKHLMKHLNVIEKPEFCPGHGNCTTFENSNGDMTIVISIHYDKMKKSPKHALHEALAHECSHAVDAIIDYIHDNEPSTEMRAYMLGWLVREGAKAFKL